LGTAGFLIHSPMTKKKRPGGGRLVLLPKKMAGEFLKIPATLYFPPEVLMKLNELCELNQLAPIQLIAQAFERQFPRWDEFYEFVTTPLEPGEPEIWPEDPMYALACVAFLHFIRTFSKMFGDPPIALEQLQREAPAQWSFRSIEDLDEPDQADWWKRSETP
jgi:hypothetical protein